MKRILYPLCSFLLLAWQPLLAQDGAPPTAGARSTAMGNTSVTFQNIYSAFGNQAGLAFLEGLSVGLHTERRFLVEDLNSASFAVAYPNKKFGTFGLAANYFGSDAYSEQRIGISYARKLFEQVALGVQFDYLGIRMPEYDNIASFTFEIGLQAQFSKHFRAGAHVFSPARIQLTDQEEDIIPAQFNVGVAYLPSEKVMVTAEVEKDIDFPFSIRAGVEYRVVEKLSLRVGTGSQPTQTGFGLGVHLKSIDIDLASSYHWVLGFTPSISVAYTVKKKEPVVEKSSNL